MSPFVAEITPRTKSSAKGIVMSGNQVQACRPRADNQFRLCASALAHQMPKSLRTDAQYYGLEIALDPGGRGSIRCDRLPRRTDSP